MENTISYWIKNRRSTFLNGMAEEGEIADNTIKELLELAVWAPTHGLVQPWHFKVYAKKGVDLFYRKQQEIYKITTLPEKFSESKYNKFREKSRYVSHVIAIISKRDPKRRFPRQEDLVSVACAMQNMYLGMQSFGIVGYLSTGNICYTQAMRNYLELDNEDDCIGFLTLGLPRDGHKYPIRKRLPVEEKTEWIRK